jgi:hypothetical protein
MIFLDFSIIRKFLRLSRAAAAACCRLLPPELKANQTMTCSASAYFYPQCPLSLD